MSLYLILNYTTTMSQLSIGVIPPTYPVRDLQRNYAAIVKKVKSNKQPVVLINKSQPEAVLVDIETYNRLVADDYQYDEDYVLKMDKVAVAEHKAGKTKKLESLKDLL